MNGLQEVYSIFFPEIFYLSKEGKQANVSEIKLIKMNQANPKSESRGGVSMAVKTPLSVSPKEEKAP